LGVLQPVLVVEGVGPHRLADSVLLELDDRLDWQGLQEVPAVLVLPSVASHLDSVDRVVEYCSLDSADLACCKGQAIGSLSARAFNVLPIYGFHIDNFNTNTNII
jgi:hypothetical protein